MILILEFPFSSAHFYEQKKWSSAKNTEVFGKCYTPQGHGHNYRLELEIDIGNRLSAKAKSEIVSSVQPVIDRLDHEHLNFKIPFFKENVPTTENISLYLKDQIEIPPPYRLTKLRLFEMDSIFVELTV
jgi:6-pyruvoyltetrahydropterin/6-carboxytetrahydropterin synthase